MAVTTTYSYPVAGTTAPTAAQSSAVNAVVSTVIATADADTTATITHNFGLSASELSNGFPIVIITPLLSNAITSGWYASAVATNSITLTKGTGAGSGNAGAQIRVTVLRPHTIIQ